MLSSLNAVISTNESSQIITGHVIYNPAYTYLQIPTENHRGTLAYQTRYNVRDHRAKVSFLERDLHAQLECV